MADMAGRVMAHLNTLAVEIGERPEGTPAHHRAEAYIRQAFQAAGLHTEDVRVDFPDWSLIDASLTRNGAAKSVDVNPFSPCCNVTAPTVALCTLADLEAADLSGRIALLYGDLAKSPIFPIDFEPIRFERDLTINRLLMEKAPAAILAVNPNPWRRLHIFEDKEFPLPSATVPDSVGRDLLLHAGDPVHLRIETRRAASHATTVIGRTPKNTPDRVVLCAHYDTKYGTPGAQDNGTGVAVMLALAESLSKRDLPVQVEFVAWADEEYGAQTDSTDVAYVARFGAGFANIRFAINLDGIGPMLENTTVTMFAHSPAFEQAIRGITGHYPSVVWIDPWIQSNHYTYFSRGVPCLALGSLTWDRTHQADDTVDWVSSARLAEVANLITDIITEVEVASPAWTRP